MIFAPNWTFQPPAGTSLAWTWHLHERQFRDPKLLALFKSLNETLIGDEISVVCDLPTLEIVDRATTETPASLFRLLATAAGWGKSGTIVVDISPKENSVLLSATCVENGQSTIQIPTAVIPVPRRIAPATLAGLRDVADGLIPLTNALAPEARFDLELDPAGQELRGALGVRGSGSAGPLLASPEGASAPRVALVMDAQDTRQALTIALGPDAVVALTDSPNVVIFDEAIVRRTRGSWLDRLTTKPQLRHAALVVISDDWRPKAFGRAHVVPWETPLSDFHQFIQALADEVESGLDRDDRVAYRRICDAIRDGIAAQAENRAVIYEDLAQNLDVPVEAARALLIKAEPRSASKTFPAPMRAALEKLEKIEVSASAIAQRLHGWTPDHLARWLKQRGLPNTKALITTAQIDHARMLLASPHTCWQDLEDALGMTRTYLKAWLTQHDITPPEHLARNTRYRTQWARVRSRHNSHS